jgi:hypothetical protein
MAETGQENGDSGHFSDKSGRGFGTSRVRADRGSLVFRGERREKQALTRDSIGELRKTAI